MKLTRITLLSFAIFATMAFSCKPDSVKPKGDDMGAFTTATGSSSLANATHMAPKPGCSTDRTGQLCMDYLGTAYPLPGTEYTLANDEEDFYLEIKSMPGWGFTEVGMDALAEGELPPIDATTGKIDMKKLTSTEVLTQASGWYMWRIPLSELEGSMKYIAHAKLVNNNNPAQNFMVWLNGDPIPTYGGFTLDYELGVQNCPSAACEAWIGASNPCASSLPACSVPSLAPGADLSEYYCQMGNNPNVKVTVCHVPPGNPANLHDICISENALPAHVIDFKPAGNECMGHHSGCHIGPCDPCGGGSSQSSIDAAAAFMVAHACTGSGGNGNGSGKN